MKLSLPFSSSLVATSLLLFFLFCFIALIDPTLSQQQPNNVFTINSIDPSRFIFKLSPGAKVNFETNGSWEMRFASTKILKKDSFTVIDSVTLYLNFTKYFDVVNKNDYTQRVDLFDSSTATVPSARGMLALPMYIYEATPLNVNETVVTVIGFGFLKSSRPNAKVLDVHFLDKTMALDPNLVSTASVNKTVSDTTILANVPTTFQTGKSHRIVNAKASNGESIFVANQSINFSYKPPTITNIVKNLDNQYFTLTGINYFAGWNITQNKLKLIIPNNPPIPASNTATFISINEKQIILNHQSLMSIGKYKIQLDLDSNISEEKEFTFNPIVTFVSSSPRQGGDVTIKGVFFNRTKNDGSNTPRDISVTLGSVSCPVVESAIDSDTALVCRLGPGNNLTDVMVKVVIDGFVSNTNYNFTQGDPVIVECRQVSPKVICKGYNFNNITDIAMPDGQTYSDRQSKETEFTINLDSVTIFKSGSIKVLSSFRDSPLFPIIFLPIPKQSTTPPTTGGTITITGKGLSPKTFANESIEGYGIFYNYRGNEMECKNVVEIASTTKVTCQVQPGGGANLQLYVRVSKDGLSRSNNISLSYNKPVVLSYYQKKNGFHLNGTDLGSSDTNVGLAAKYGGTDLPSGAATFNVENGTEPIVYLTSDTPNGKLYLIVEGQQSNGIDLIDIKPAIENINPIPTRGGTVTVNGYFFNTLDPKNITFLSGNVECTNLTIVSSNQFTCQAAGGFGKTRPVTLRVNNRNTSALDPVVHLSYQPPTIETTTSTNYTGGLVTIIGTNFHIQVTNVTIGTENPVDCAVRNIIDYNKIVCYLKKWNNDDGILKNETYLVTITVGDQSISKLDFKWGLEGYSYGMSPDKPKKWLIAAIVIPVAAGVLAITAFSFILFRKHQKFKKLQSININNINSSYICF
ncbi:IPT/TIG domain-containing protein [Cavenderia fasciculata]|uniref:IPT/TIG domain-containing protein n=1 Tax=Cavenderia fasciculata TaxID=261658 RepID=F4PW18_CACFS|nr:IPT/TIG domain-containing protein [Cavenderia fasciculata]EGG20182.1 IPT/TIG domain-containing protein [Cavenderia fasciculata]|eukprot:XP_004367165.1 IPT/TIG domain-containing protein [Cavenderia fasciculata]